MTVRNFLKTNAGDGSKHLESIVTAKADGRRAVISAYYARSLLGNVVMHT